MYTRFIATAFSLLPLTLAAQQKFTVTGSLKNIPASENARVVVMYEAMGDQHIDTIHVKNGQYRLSGELLEPARAQFNIYFAEDNFKPVMESNITNVFMLYIDKGNTSVVSTDKFSNFKATGPGAAAERENEKLEKDLEPWQQGFSAFQQMPRPDKDDVATRKRQGEILDSLFNLRRDIMHKFLRKNPNSRIAMDVMETYAGNPMKAIDSVKAVFESLSPDVKAFPSAKRFKKNLEVELKLGIGRPAIQFTQADTAGVNVSLASFRGKYVLLDFWASWCGPCRRENPFVVEAFNKYRDKNFTVLSVSLDGGSTRTSKQQWLDAIHHDGLTGWTHVSDMKGWDNAVSREYGINSVPQNFLINPDGIIISRNVRGEQLAKTLERELNK